MGDQPSTSVQNEVFCRIFQVTLDGASANAQLARLPQLSQDLRSEGQPLHITTAVLDRVLVARLIEEPPAASQQLPIEYLVGCYARADSEIAAAQQTQHAQQLTAAIQEAQQLIVNYVPTVFTDIVLSSPQDLERSQQWLMSSLTQQPTATPHVSAGMLDAIARSSDVDTLRDVFEAVLQHSGAAVTHMSILNDGVWQHIAVLSALAQRQAIAVAMTQARKWLPSDASLGRFMQVESLLGPYFGVSCIPDGSMLAQPQPNVLEQCFKDVDDSNPSANAAIHSAFSTLRMLHDRLTRELHGCVKAMLRQPTRAAMLDWLAAAIERNVARQKMEIPMLQVASHGFFANLNAVLLTLCDPFLDFYNSNALQRIDVLYVTGRFVKARVSFAEDTKLCMSRDEENAWLDELQRQRGSAGPPAEAHFVCECFFMTAKALHLGMLRLMGEVKDSGERAARMQQYLNDIGDAMPPPQRAMMTTQMKHLKQLQLSYMSLLSDESFLTRALAFYRLMAVWMIRVASPPAAAGGLPELPLPDPCAREFASLPEFFIEDIVELLLWVTRVNPQLLSTVRMEELVMFATIFIGSPKAVRNPFLRFRIAEVLHAWLPSNLSHNSRRGRGFSQRHADSLAFLFEAHPLVTANMVRSILQLYVDIEFTDRSNQFYEKFHMRSILADILRHAWSIHVHKQAWLAAAAEEGDGGGYVRFCNMLMNDAIYLLDEAMKKLPELKENEAIMADASRLAALSAEDRRNRQQSFSQSTQQLRFYLHSAESTIELLKLTTAEIQKPFLIPEMVERLSSMLNYFLMYLTGPERSKLKVTKEMMDKINFNPRELLTSICEIYIHIASADPEAIFTRAIAADARSYRPTMFDEAARVLSDHALMPRDAIERLEYLSEQVQLAAQEAQQEDEMDEDAPDEFLDPILNTIMKDPVTMPTSGTNIDRATIMRHLLSDERDPINRAPLRVQDLVPNTELKARIDAWRQQRRSSGT